LRAPPQRHDLEGLKHDQQVKSDGGVLDIEEVILQSSERLLDVSTLPPIISQKGPEKRLTFGSVISQ